MKKPVNVYLNTVDTRSTGLVNRLIQSMDIGNMYLTTIDPEFSQQFEGHLSLTFNYYDLVACRYESYAFYDVAEPLDVEILLKMSPYESQIQKMMERHQRYGLELDFDSRIAMYHRHVRYWNSFLEHAEIDFAIAANAPHEVFDYVIYCLCKIKNIPFVFSYFAPWGTSVYIMDDMRDQGREVLETYMQMAIEYKDTGIEDITLPQEFERQFLLYADTTKDITPFYMKSENKGIMPGKIKKGLSLLWNRDFVVLKESLSAFSLYVRTALKRKLQEGTPTKKMWQEYAKFSRSPNLSAPYIYFPLHYQPEQTTCPLGDWFVHQLLAIEMISFFLPKDTYLYVKEHPNQRGLGRDIRLYRQISSMKNCVLVDREADTYRLIDHCVAVASVTGTAGWEGLFRNKPFIMFGYNLYMHAPGVFHIKTNEDMRRALESIFTHGPSHTLKDLKIFLKAIAENTLGQYLYDGVMKKFSIALDRDENAARIADAYAQVLQLHLARKGGQGACPP